MNSIHLMRAYIAILAILLSSHGSWAGEIPALKVAVSPNELRFTWKTNNVGTLGIREVPIHTAGKEPRSASILWTGEVAAGAAIAPRHDGQRDRLFSSKFELFNPADGRRIGEPQFATDFSASPARTHSLKRSEGKKGLACIVDLDDCRFLGLHHANENIDIATLIDWRSADPASSFEFEGRKVGLLASGVEALDKSLKAKSDAGMSTIGILLHYARKPHIAENPGEGTAPRVSPLLHPGLDLDKVPAEPVAFNTATAEGHFYYRAIVYWLIDRYTQADGRFGRLTGLVIGNELQNHWVWYRMGEAAEDDVLRDYLAAVRTADLVARSIHPEFRIYISMDHHWTLRGPTNNPLREMSGVTLIQKFAEQARRTGDFPWHLAFHPYPEDLFEPRFWNDASAPMRFDAPRITFRNLEVLVRFLRQPAFTYNGRSRHIALTEQGFHSPKSAEGPALQAAAFAYAWKRVQAMPEIESFIYHRHVDHPHEGGLHLGLREHDGGTNPAGMGEKRLLWDVFQKAGTSGEDAAFEFALPIVGRTDWKDLIAPDTDESLPPRAEK